MSIASQGRRSGRIRNGGIATPIAFDGDPVVWAAWLYYEEKLTQEEIAVQFGTSRGTVINMLQEARDRGVVSIAVAPDHLQSVTLSRKLADRYGLEGCVVVPDDGGRVPDYERVGRAGARLLASRLQPNDVLGVSWGLTVLALANSLPPCSIPGLSAIQVTGSFVGTYEMSAELCTSNIANRTGGRCVYIHAPGLVSQPEVRTMLMREPTLREEFRILDTCTRLVFGVGSVKPNSTAFVSGYMRHEDAAPYVRRGAVAVLAGRFIDAGGRAVVDALDERMIGLTVEQLDRIPDRLCVACGVDKAEAIAATLAGGHATLLVTDAVTARALMAHGTPQESPL
jgi:DNA-binding transcriptional regulator LsrR (DeoR family)